MTQEPLIFVVDDDGDVRESTRVLLESAGFKVQDYKSAAQFLTNRPAAGGCLIVDIRMPEMDGLELQEELIHRGVDLPVIVMTGHGDVPLAVRAMKAGALDFIEKPFNAEAMLASVRRAIEIGKRTRNKLAEAKAAQDLLE
ncbi:MAG TPA: response regulator transcription factor, partial [Rhizomicrobium sp.]|nr:response regulator transcription factor [Rhizomicrobium sp.]